MFYFCQDAISIGILTGYHLAVLYQEKNLVKELSALDLLTTRETTDDTSLSFSPKTLTDYVGQQAIKEKLNIYVQACNMRGEALDHVLLFGPPGLGKTTLAKIIAQELGAQYRITSAPIIERTGDLVAMLSNLQPREVFFIDEIHRLPKQVEEVLYSAMENFCVDMIIGQGAGAQSVRLPINPFTLIGATTKTGLISGPLQTRFGIIERLDFYESEELAKIVEHNAHHAGLAIQPDAAYELGRRSRGTPRIVKRIFRRVRDFAQVHRCTTIDKHVVHQALLLLDIDENGLNKLDRSLLRSILYDFNGGPVGIETLAAMTGEDRETLEDTCEPFLMRNGFIQKTTRGRIIPETKRAWLRQLIPMQT